MRGLLSAGLLLAATAVTASAAPPIRPPLLRDLNHRFPATRHWFGMVSDLQFTRPGGSIVPRFDTLHSPRVLAHDPAGESLDVRLPASAQGWHTIGEHNADSIWVRTRELGLGNVPAEIDNGVVVYRGAASGADVLYKLTPTHVDEYLYVTDRRQRLTRTIQIQLGPGVAALRGTGASVEVVDARGDAHLRVSAPLARAADGTRRRGTIRVAGDTLVESLDLSGLATPILVDPDWSTTGTMASGHWADAAWLARPGHVMVVGGCALSGCPASFARSGCGQVLATTEVWSDATATWTAGPALATARYSFGGVPLSGGGFLVAGGCTTTSCSEATNSAEVYRPSDDSWHGAGKLSRASAHVMAAPLPGGNALVAGGCDGSRCYGDTNVWNASSGAWTSADALATPRGFATATALQDGRVLVIGGCGDPDCQTIFGDALLFDPTTGKWSAAGSMTTPRAGHSATLLADGTVLVAGGCPDAACATTLRSAELWNASGFTSLPSMAGARHDHTATLLQNGYVLLAGGANGAGASLPATEIWVTDQKRFLPIEAMHMDRAFHVAVALDSGDVIVAGGCNPTTCMPWAEIYDPAGLPGELDGGIPAIPDAGPAPDATPLAVKADPHPNAYRTGVSRCATDDTQELTCPVAGFPSQDGDFGANDHPFTQTASGDLTDPATGLTWQATGDGKTYDGAGAAAACAALAPAGTWRLPSVVELATIVDYGVNNPSIDPLFQDAQSTNYWTSTPVGKLQWTVRFDFGEVIPTEPTSKLPVRCVRGQMSMVPGHLRQAGAFSVRDKTVLDDRGHLEWQRYDDGVLRSWRDALSYCASLTLNGEDGWHLPNVSELRGLVEYGGGTGDATIDPAFGPRADSFWTSTPNDGAPTLALSVAFNLGIIDGVTTTGVAYARCVRHVPPASGCSCQVGGGAPAIPFGVVLLLAGIAIFRARPSGRRGARRGRRGRRGSSPRPRRGG